MTTTLATFSIWHNGQLADRRYVTDEDDDDMIWRVAEHQAKLVAAIDLAGRVYLVEVEFWDGEHVRWGTDENGMVLSMEVAVEQLEQGIERMRKERGTA